MAWPDALMSVRERLKVTVCIVGCCAGLAAACLVAAGVGVGVAPMAQIHTIFSPSLGLRFGGHVCVSTSYESHSTAARLTLCLVS